MNSRKNLTRFTYETTDFKGWRLCIARKGTTFTKYYSDREHGGPRKALNSASVDLDDIKEILDSSPLRGGKLTKTTIQKVENILA